MKISENREQIDKLLKIEDNVEELNNKISTLEELKEKIEGNKQ